ncbi:MAG: hypothetical protein HGGPFJEG_00725 [Ignavibacteria bacterium]|nr:hypothetical protein [Ignavibacteria bacterium]
MQIRAIFLLFLILFSNDVFSQKSRWINYTDFKNITSIASDPATNNIYCSSKGGLFVFDYTAGTVLKEYTNLNGLVNNDITSLAIDNNRKLWIGATDGSISVLNLGDNTWKYIYDIKNSSESNKIVNFIYPAGNFIFIATGYGIHKVSAVNYTFIDAPYYRLGNFPINTSVYSLAADNNILYAATKAGVAYVNYLTSNLNDPLSWSNYNIAPMNTDVKTIETFDNKIFAGSLTGFSYFNGTDWFPYPNAAVSNANTKFIHSIQDRLFFISEQRIFSANRNDLSVLTEFPGSYSYTVLGDYRHKEIIPGISDNGILYNNMFIYPNSPFTNIFNQVTIDSDNNVWGASGLVYGGFYKFDGNLWENYNISTHPQIGNSNWFQKIVSGNGNVWALGFGGGPTLINGNSITNFNPSNTILPGISNDPNFCVPNGGAYDNAGVFWLSFFQSNNGSSLYSYLGGFDWFAYPNPSIITSATLSEMAVDSYNTKWIVSGGTRSGVYFFNENNTLTNISDDVFGFYDNSELGADITNVYDVIVDKNNEVWIATNNGVFIINNPLGAVQNPTQKPPAYKLGIISGNLRVPFTENCICISNDILNDKWIGTETNGVFHLSSDGSTLIEQFNISNSPMLSNQIKTIAVSNKSGRAYFGSNNGLSSLSTDAIEPVADFDEIISSPNPYVIPSDVNLKIDGLIENSTIKIISVSGVVITEFDSPGGKIATWNGRNSSNELIPTGIYIIVAFNKDGSKVGKGKVAVVRK